MKELDAERLLRRRLTRGQFVQLSAVAAGTAFLAACGGSDESSGVVRLDRGRAGQPVRARVGRVRVPDVRGQGRGRRAAAVRRQLQEADVHLPDERRPGARQGARRVQARTSSTRACATCRTGSTSTTSSRGTRRCSRTSTISTRRSSRAARSTASSTSSPPTGVSRRCSIARTRSSRTARSRGTCSTTTATRGRSPGGTARSRTSSIYGYTSGLRPVRLGQLDRRVLEDAKKYLIEKKKHVRNMWSSQTDFDNDVANGNVWIGYAWGGSYTAAKKAGSSTSSTREPKEGRLSWNCGFVLAQGHEELPPRARVRRRVGRPASAAWIIPNYAYGHINTAVDTSTIDPELVEVFHLDDPTRARGAEGAHRALRARAAEVREGVGRGQGGVTPTRQLGVDGNQVSTRRRLKRGGAGDAAARWA